MTLTIAIMVTLAMGLVCLAVALTGRSGTWLLWLDRMAALGVGLLALTMLTGWGRTPSPAITWPPGLDTTSLSYSPPGIYLAVTAFAALALSRLASPAQPPGAPVGAWSAAWVYLMCALTALALTVDQFLVRYVVLEFVALGTLIALLGALPSPERLRALPRLYLLFRLGDVLLLAAILLLHGLSGTFAIDAMVQRGADATGPQRMALLLSALLAVAVKTGLPPFQVWVERTQAQPWQQRIWNAAVGLPVLGAYLLYRISPIVRAAGMLSPLAVVGALLLILSIWRALRSQRAGARLAWWSAGHSALALIALAANGMTPYLISFVPVRIALGFLLDRYAPRVEAGAAPPRGLERVFWWLGRSANAFETRVLESANARLATLLWNLAHLARDTGETGLEALNAGIVIHGHSVAEMVHEWHQGRLRRNLLWATCALVVAIVLVLIFR